MMEAEIDLRASKKREAEMDLNNSKKKKKKKKAVLIGLKHPDPQMNGGLKDTILRMKDYLIELRGFSEENITLMIEEDEEEESIINKDNIPTNDNLRSKLCSLFVYANPGDTIFIQLIAYGCSDGSILTANKLEEHLPDSFFRALILEAKQIGCNLTVVSDCLIEPAAKCSCPRTRVSRVPLTFTQKSREEELAELLAESEEEFEVVGFSSLAPTSLSYVDILDPEKKTEYDGDGDSPRVVLLTPFRSETAHIPMKAPIPTPIVASELETTPIPWQCQWNIPTPTELFFPPPPKGGSSTTTSPPQRTLSYGGFTNAVLDVIEETHGKVTNLELAQKAMEKFGGEIPNLRCSHHNHAYASFVC